MAIKRLTIELDDSPQAGPTAIPDGAHQGEIREFKAREPTKIPTREEAEETRSPESGRVSPRTVGRTTSDLVAEFVTEPRAMATLLIFVPFPFFATGIKQVSDLLYPAIVGIVLNTVWFGVPLALRFFRKERSDT